MNAQATLKAKTATFTNVAAAVKKSQLAAQNVFFSALLIQGFTVEAHGENEIVIKNNFTKAEHLGLVVGSKVVILTGESIKKSGLTMKLNHSVALDTFAKSEQAYVLNLEEGTVKGAKVAHGWVPAEGAEKTITLTALMALSNVTLVSTKPVDGAIEHFVIGQGQNVNSDSIAEVRATLTNIIEANGGFVVVEKEPKERKARVTSFNAQECQKGTSAEALRVEKAGAREDRNAYAEAEKEAKAEQKRRDLRNAQARKYAKKAERQATKAAAKAAA